MIAGYFHNTFFQRGNSYWQISNQYWQVFGTAVAGGGYRDRYNGSTWDRRGRYL